MDATRKTTGACGRRGFTCARTGALHAAYDRTRDRYHTADDLRAAAARLTDLADNFAAGTFDGRAVTAGDALTVGLSRLIIEAGRHAMPGGAA